MTVSVRKALLGVIISLAGIAVAALVAFWFAASAIDRALGMRPILSEPASQILSAASMLVGVFWITWAHSYIVFVGKGLPPEVFGKALHPTTVLVTTGPYAYTRNPMVIGALFIFLGVAFLQRSVTGLIAVPVAASIVALYLVEFEEAGLVRRFGEDYEEYRRHVPLMIPRIFTSFLPPH